MQTAIRMVGTGGPHPRNDVDTETAQDLVFENFSKYMSSGNRELTSTRRFFLRAFSRNSKLSSKNWEMFCNDTCENPGQHTEPDPCTEKQENCETETNCADSRIRQ